MHRSVRMLSVLLAALLLWFVVGHWLQGGSERFYLLVPPVAVVMALLFSSASRQQLKTQVLPCCGYLAALAFCCTLYVTWATRSTMPVLLGSALFNENVREISITVYFLLAITLVVAGARFLLRHLLRRLAGWLFPSPAGQLAGRRRRFFVGEIMPTVMLVPLVLPYLLGTMYIHRFKMPNRLSPMDAAQRSFEAVHFLTADGMTIRGWFIPAKQAPSSRTLMICHGLGANRSSFLSYLKVGDALQANVLMFDFRGHGESDGHTVTLGHEEKWDVLAAVQYLRTERPSQARQVVGLGISMGSAALVRGAAEVEPPLEAVILDSGFASAVELTDHVLGLFPACLRPCLAGVGVPLASLDSGCWLSEVRPVDRVAFLHAPVLIIHAQDDGLIPVDHAYRLYEHAAGPKALWITPQGGHGSALFTAEAEYLQNVKQVVEGGRPAR